MSDPNTRQECIKALAEAQAEFPVIPRNRTAKMEKYSYKYADLGDIVTAVRPVLRRHGLGMSQTVHDAWLVSVLVHIPTGHAVESRVPLVVQGQGPQAMGSALTYARRYGICLLLGIVTDEDDDGHAGQQLPANKNQPTAKPAAAQAPVGQRVNGAALAPVTEKQLARLFAIANKAGVPKIRIDQKIKELFKKGSAKELVRVEYDGLCKLLEEYAAANHTEG